MEEWKNGDLLFHQGWLTRRGGPLKPNDIRLTKKSRLTSRLILSCFKTPLLKLLRHDASLDAFIFIFLLLLPLFSPRWPSYIKAGLGILLRKWAANCVLSNLSWYAGETIKEETDRAISKAPWPCLVLLSCWQSAGALKRRLKSAGTTICSFTAGRAGF